MQELYLLTERTRNDGSYEDAWHETRAIGVYSSFESAMQMVSVFKQSTIAFCEIMASKPYMDYKFSELEKTEYDPDTFATGWHVAAGSDIETTDFAYFIEKTTVDEHNLRFVLPPWLQYYDKEEEE